LKIDRWLSSPTKVNGLQRLNCRGFHLKWRF
jgi:hypothetical protein